MSARAGCDRITVPALLVTGWWDAFVDGALQAYGVLSRRTAEPRASLVIGPWSHVPWGARVGDLDFGEVADRSTVDDAQIAFLTAHLSAAPTADPGPRVRYFVLGDDAWFDAADWPPPEAALITGVLTATETLHPPVGRADCIRAMGGVHQGRPNLTGSRTTQGRRCRALGSILLLPGRLADRAARPGAGRAAARCPRLHQRSPGPGPARSRRGDDQPVDGLGCSDRRHRCATLRR